MNKYVIVSRQSIESKNTDPFFKEHNTDDPFGHVAVWCANISEAKIFDTEQAAWDMAFDIWGNRFARQQFWVVSVSPEAFAASRAHWISTMVDDHEKKRILRKSYNEALYAFRAED